RSGLRRALARIGAGERVCCAPDTTYEKVLKRAPLTLADHMELDDAEGTFHVKQWQRSEHHILNDLSRRFVGRRLFKAIDLDMPEGERSDFLAAARALVVGRGFDPAYYF